MRGLKAVPKEQIKDASVTLSERQSQNKKNMRAGMAKAQNSLMAAVQERFKEMHKNTKGRKPSKVEESDSEDD